MRKVLLLKIKQRISQHRDLNPSPTPESVHWQPGKDIVRTTQLDVTRDPLWHLSVLAKHRPFIAAR